MRPQPELKDLQELAAAIEGCKASADRHWSEYIRASADLAKLREHYRRAMRSTQPSNKKGKPCNL